MSHPGKFVSVNLNRSYGQSASSSHGRPSRPASSGGGGGGGGGMVVLSRPRSSSTAKPPAPKLSVPPPLNLPSLRKEHERFDGGASAAGGGASSAPPRSGGAAIGWTKPSPSPDKPTDSAALPSAAKPPSYGFPARAVILRGEDFPSLKAAVASPPPSPMQRQKEADGQRITTPEARPVPLGMRPQVGPLRTTEPMGFSGSGSAGVRTSTDRLPQHDAGPLPLVRLRYDSDWTDDERDTGLSLPEHNSRERRFGRSEAIVQGSDLYGTVKATIKTEPFRKDVATSSKDGGQDRLWWSPVVSQHDREKTDGRPYSGRRGNSGQSSNQENMIGGGSKDLWNARREPVASGVESYGSGRVVEGAAERHDHSSNNWYRGSSFQNDAGSKVQLSGGNKGSLFNELATNFTREKRPAASPAKPYSEDSGFDSIASVSLTALKKKKEVHKPVDFHDPVRESFEAELDRILKVQEQERQRVMEEQSRAMDIARKQEEERVRLIREEEEMRRLVEEQARQAALQAEQERLEAARRTEEQRISREEEKRRIAMEEERRKEAARQKLLELEARIARRQAESNMRDEKLTSFVDDERASAVMKDRDVPRNANVGDIQDIDRIGEHISNSASLNSCSLNRYSDTISRVHTSRDEHSSFMDSGEHTYYGARAPFQEQENVHHSPRHDTNGARRGSFSKKDTYDGFGIVSVRPSSRGRAADSLWIPENYCHGRISRWDASMENNRLDRPSDFDTEFFNNDRFGDAAWLPSSSHGNPHAQQGDAICNSEANSFPCTRSRYSVRQPRVLPPPTMSSVHRSTVGASTQHTSSFVDGGMPQHGSRNDEQSMQSQYGSVYQEAPHHHATTASVEDPAINEQQNGERDSARLGSQSSLSVSSPPSSPPHVSHDEMDVSGDSPALPTSADGDRTVISDNDHAASTLDAANTSRMTTASTGSRVEDDEWASENNEDMQQQDEYDEEGDSYQEDEINEGDDENLDLDDEFATLELQGQTTPGEMEQDILGFDEGVQVQIPRNSELELTSQNTERATGIQLSSSSIMQQEMESGSIGPSDLISETQTSLQSLALDQVNDPTNETTGEPSASLQVSAQEKVTSVSSFQLPAASSADSIISSAPAIVSQSEVPVNLQFGLFSRPPLIPSPIPAIQIGSIQMPIHLHTQVNPSMSQMHSSSAPLFQFGQLRYGPPMSQNNSPLPSQSMPFTHSSAPAPVLMNQHTAGAVLGQINQDLYQNIPGERIPTSFGNKSVIHASKLPLVLENSNSRHLSVPANSQVKDADGFHGQMDRPPIVENTTCRVSKAETQRNHDPSARRNYKPISSNREFQAQSRDDSSQFVSDGKSLIGLKAQGVVSGGRGRRFGYAVRDSNVRLSGSVVEPSQKDSRGLQRRARRNIRRAEFRVRENVEKNQSQTSESLNNGELDERPYSNGSAVGISVRNLSRREDGDTGKTSRAHEASNLGIGSSSAPSSYHNKMEKGTRKGSYYERSHGGNKNSRTGAIPEGYANTSFQSGIVRIVKQQGIEVPVDADGFIEVRSKKHIMNVRRELREKENKSKMKMAKTPRKQHPVSLHSSSSPRLNKPTDFLGGEAAKKVPSDAVSIQGANLDHAEPAAALKGNTATPLLPIGPPSANIESSHMNYYANKPSQSQAASDSVTTNAAAKLIPDLPEDNNKAASVSTPLTMGSWDSTQINQQVMPLTQTQLEEAMKPAKFEQEAGSSFSLESSSAMTPTVNQEKPFPSSVSPINSLLAGEKIQFGAVTSPTVLPSISRTISSGLGAPGSSRPDLKLDRSLPAGNNDLVMFFDKEQATEEPSQTLEDVEAEAEAEAEAAASAVAVAAISSDEVVGSTIDTTTAPASDSKNFSTNDVAGLTPGSTSQAGQSSAEEPLSVALPADLSVDTPSLSLWPPLPSPQASGPMLSQFPGAQPSHFSCFEMNPVLGGHIFAFGPNDESAGSQGPQPQRSNALPSAPLGAWPQCHSGVDSFYRPPTGFAAPFISPGGIPGMQGHPHMVVYNHFTPVGQFGQMGLGFMGAAYIPSDKQPDWKHNQVPSVIGVSQGDINSQNMASGQVTPSTVPTPIQHVRPTSLMPIPSPLTMFDIAPFQPSTDIQMQTCWPHMPAPPLHSVPLSVPLQQHPIEGAVAPQFVANVPMDNKASAHNQLQEPSPSIMPSDGNRSFPNAVVTQFPDELGLVEHSPSSSSIAQTMQPSFCRASAISNDVPSGAKVMVRMNLPNVNNGAPTGTASNVKGGQVTNMASKSQQPSSSSDQQYHHPVDRRARPTQKASAGNEWHRRSGYQARNQNSGPEKNFGTGRMKQIYVAKLSSTSGPAPSG